MNNLTITGARLHNLKGIDVSIPKNNWIKDPGGITTGGWGLTITPRDMARPGLLYLNRGTWDGTPVIPEALDRRVNGTECERIRVLLVA